MKRWCSSSFVLDWHHPGKLRAESQSQSSTSVFHLHSFANPIWSFLLGWKRQSSWQTLTIPCYFHYVRLPLIRLLQTLLFYFNLQCCQIQRLSTAPHQHIGNQLIHKEFSYPFNLNKTCAFFWDVIDLYLNSLLKYLGHFNTPACTDKNVFPTESSTTAECERAELFQKQSFSDCNVLLCNITGIK